MTRESLRKALRSLDDLYRALSKEPHDRTGESTGAVNCAHSCLRAATDSEKGGGVSTRWCQATETVVPMGTT